MKRGLWTLNYFKASGQFLSFFSNLIYVKALLRGLNRHRVSPFSSIKLANMYAITVHFHPRFSRRFLFSPLLSYGEMIRHYKTFESVDEILGCDHSNESYWAVLFIKLYKVVLTFESAGEILWCYHSNETSLAELLHSSIYLRISQKEIWNFFGKFSPWLL